MVEWNLQPTLRGDTLLLQPLQAGDFERLYAAASDPLIWEQHPEPTRYQRAVFETFFAKALESRGALLVLDHRSGEVIGSSRYYDCDTAKASIAIGFTFLSRSHWGGVTNAELKRLMLDHVFQWADSVWFHIGVNNWRSRKAMEKIGGVLDRIEPWLLNGVSSDYCYYRIDRADR